MSAETPYAAGERNCAAATATDPWQDLAKAGYQIDVGRSAPVIGWYDEDAYPIKYPANPIYQTNPQQLGREFKVEQRILWYDSTKTPPFRQRNVITTHSQWTWGSSRLSPLIGLLYSDRL